MSQSNNVITVDHVTKTYRAGVGRARVREMLPPPAARVVQRLLPNWWARDCFDALDDISFTVGPGEAVGIVGHNGAGKTTLLRVLAGITAPSSGRVAVSGQVAGLIDAVVGFHPEFTGRENIMILGGLLGVSRKEMGAQMEQVLDFAGISDLADTPMKRYSAGMGARLGFAVMTAARPDVLLIDEVLVVGDAAYQRKSIEWLEEYRRSGGTLLFVSHNLGLIRAMTHRTLWIEHGKLSGEGATTEVLEEYVRGAERRHDETRLGTGSLRRTIGKTVRTEGLKRWGWGGARVVEAHVEQTPRGDRVTLDIHFDGVSLSEALFCVGFQDEGGNQVGVAASGVVPLSADAASVKCVIDPLPLREGIYFPVVSILTAEGRVCDRWQLDRAVVVEDGNQPVPRDFGPVEFGSSWEPVGRGELDGRTG